MCGMFINREIYVKKMLKTSNEQREDKCTY